MPSSAKPCCLVTGCAGNVGSNITVALLNKGCSVVGIDNFYSGTPGNMTDFCDNPSFSFHERSITDSSFLDHLFQERLPFTAVIHLAAIISVPYSMEHPEETLRINHEASLNLHARSQNAGCGTFVFAGSAAEYGRPLSRPASEQDAGDSISPYGLSKHLVSRAIEESGYGCSLRFFNIYGPTRAKPGPYDGVVRLFLDRSSKGLPPVILGDGQQTRDFLFLGDAVEALVRASGVESAEPLTGIFNVGTGLGTSIDRLARNILELYGIPGEPEFAPERPGDIRFSVADNTKLRRATGWVPATRVEQGLPLTIKGMRRFMA
jgi:UDP-glucose 4-epimerase